MAKFIHTSDWHIGRLFQNVSLLQDQLCVLDQIKNYAIVHQVDALLIAGDLFDRAVPPAEAIDALNSFLTNFTNTLAIPVIIITGNHDSAKRLGFGASFMKASGVHILSDIREVATPVMIQTPSGPLQIFGIPYHDPVEVSEAFSVNVKTHNEAHTYLAELILQARTPGIPSVLMSHCFIDGGEESDSERRLSIGGIDRVDYGPLVDFDYVALGHLHSPHFKGAEHIRYSGSLLKYSFSEHRQVKGITLVEINETTRWQHLPLKPMRDMRVIEGTLAALITQGQQDANADDYILAKLTDSQDLLEPMTRLRQVYPNVLELERTRYVPNRGSQLTADVGNHRTEDQVFTDFFHQVMNDELTENQQRLLLEVIKEAQLSLEVER